MSTTNPSFFPSTRAAAASAARNGADMPHDAMPVTCPCCEATFPASTAEWCNCIGTEPTPLCTVCRSCSCNESNARRQAFWLAAPTALRDRRTAVMTDRRLAAAERQMAEEAVDVLVVDDDEEIRLIATYMVQSMGYRVDTAASASEALARIQQRQPAVVITDAFMPNVDGRTLCRMIKVDLPAIRVIVMSSLYTAPRYKYEAYKTFRADEYLVKPIDFFRLRDVLERFIPAAEAAR